MLLTDKGKRVADTPSIPVSLQLHILTITILLCVIVFQGFQVIGVIKPLAGAGTGSLMNLQSAPASVPATATASLKTSGFFAPPKTRQDLGALLEKLGLKVCNMAPVRASTHFQPGLPHLRPTYCDVGICLCMWLFHTWSTPAA